MDDYKVNCCSGAVRLQSELQAAFNKVAPRGNWKGQIAQTIAASDRAIIHDAVIHFTGSVPTFHTLPSGRLAVTAAGYYAAVGA